MQKRKKGSDRNEVVRKVVAQLKLVNESKTNDRSTPSKEDERRVAVFGFKLTDENNDEKKMVYDEEVTALFA